MSSQEKIINRTTTYINTTMNKTTEQINTIIREHSVSELTRAILKLELEKLVLLAKLEQLDEIKS